MRGMAGMTGMTGMTVMAVIDEVEEAAKKTANPTRYVRYHTDGEYADKIKKGNWEREKKAMAESEEFRLRRKEYMREYGREYRRERYARDVEFRDRVNAASNARRRERVAEMKACGGSCGVAAEVAVG